MILQYDTSCVVFLSPLSQAVPVKLSLDALLQMPGVQVRETMRRLGSSTEECARLSAALSCLKSATESGESKLCLQRGYDTHISLRWRSH